MPSIMPPRGKREVLRRSWLYVPLHEQKFIDKAMGLRPDVIILDLQDGVPGAMKEAARGRVASAVASLRQIHEAVFVRLNPGDARWVDLDACIEGKVDQVLISMAEDVSEVRQIGDRLRAAYPSGPRVPEMALALESAAAR